MNRKDNIKKFLADIPCIINTKGEADLILAKVILENYEMRKTKWEIFLDLIS